VFTREKLSEEERGQSGNWDQIGKVDQVARSWEASSFSASLRTLPVRVTTPPFTLETMDEPLRLRSARQNRTHPYQT
jgi:hypothetical protein